MWPMSMDVNKRRKKSSSVPLTVDKLNGCDAAGESVSKSAAYVAVLNASKSGVAGVRPPLGGPATPATGVKTDGSNGEAREDKLDTDTADPSKDKLGGLRPPVALLGFNASSPENVAVGARNVGAPDAGAAVRNEPLPSVVERGKAPNAASPVSVFDAKELRLDAVVAGLGPTSDADKLLPVAGASAHVDE